MRQVLGRAATRIACIVLAALATASAAAYEFVTVGDGETITIGEGVANNEQSELSAAAGSTIVLPQPTTAGGTVFVYTRLILTGSGTVTLVAPDENFNSTVVAFVSGLAATNTATLHVAPSSVTALKVGRTCGEKDTNYPLADIANVTFANSDGVFCLRESVTVKTIPATYAVNPSGDTRLALIGTNPLHLTDSLVLTNFDVVALSPDCVPTGCTVRVAPGRNFYIKPCLTQAKSGDQFYANTWFWAGHETGSGTYPIVLEGKGARVICRNNVPLDLLAKVSGMGEILLRPDNRSDIKTYYQGVTYTTSWNSYLTIPVNKAVESELDDSWQTKVAHWFDASDTDSFVFYDYPNVVTNVND
jgi:hypothetical protein